MRWNHIHSIQRSVNGVNGVHSFLKSVDRQIVTKIYDERSTCFPPFFFPSQAMHQMPISQDFDGRSSFPLFQHMQLSEVPHGPRISHYCGSKI
jgi:hypothetical protein